MPFANFPWLPLYDRLAPLLAVVFGALLWLQWRHPLRRQHFSALRRVVRNLLFAVPSFLTLRLLLLPIPLAVAVWAQNHDFGLLNWLDMSPSIAAILEFLWLDYSYYWWHVATHRVPFLWRFHNVHHTDLDMDVSTATRFHCGELMLSVLFRVAQVLLFGVAPATLLVFEIVFETAGQFHHSNWRLPVKFEERLQRVLVTPRMHGIHHSVVREQTDSNWGTIFNWWDRLHRTLRLDIQQDSLTIGVPGWRDEQELTLLYLWKMPFGKQRPFV
jgi:sterol desaturase/sphingolipid hydroxylase (fatty acid hydroxylase superfamily)